MPYSETTRAELRTQLSARLQDSTNVFWSTTECDLHINEALRTFGLCSGFWRERGTFDTVADSAWYDIPLLLESATSEFLLDYTVTDREIIQQVQYALLESATSQTAWTGTAMFTYAAVVAAIQNRRNQFLADTGIVVTKSIQAVTASSSGREELSEDIIDVRRAAWIGEAPLDYYSLMWRSDERQLTAYDPAWTATQGTPENYSIMAPPPLTIQLAPPPSVDGAVELTTVNIGTALDPATLATILGIPDDLTPAIKWGALADLLGHDGIAADPMRAAFCEQRYQQYVQMARLLAVIIHAEIEGEPLIPSTVQEFDSGMPNWQNVQGTPTEMAIAGTNLIALSNVPDGVYEVTLDVVRKTPVPVMDVDVIQIGQEQLDMIVDYAEHLALFKVGGAEWHATQRQAQNFMIQSATYNQRLAASALYIFDAANQSQREKQEVVRRQDGTVRGAGSLING